MTRNLQGFFLLAAVSAVCPEVSAIQTKLAVNMANASCLRPQCVQFAVQQGAGSKDLQNQKGYIIASPRDVLQRNGFPVVDGECIESNENASKWRDLTVRLVKPDSNVYMELEEHPSIAGIKSVVLFYPYSEAPDDYYAVRISASEQADDILLWWPVYDEEPPVPENVPEKQARYLIVSKNREFEEQGVLERWFGWLRYWDEGCVQDQSLLARCIRYWWNRRM